MTEYACQHCDDSFETVTELNEHREREHEEKLGGGEG